MFQKARKQSAYLKIALSGASGAGKTFSALRLARGLVPNGKIAVIDTENGSSNLYASQFDFDVTEIEPPYTINKLIEATKYALNNDYDVIIQDSGSHWWEGVLSYKKSLDDRGGNSFANWQTANEHYKLYLRATLASNVHTIVTLRSKTEYLLQENEKGKFTPKKVGLAPIHRDGVEYEFSCVLDISASSHEAQATKDRTNLFGDSIFMITEETGARIMQWLNDSDDLQGAEPSSTVIGMAHNGR